MENKQDERIQIEVEQKQFKLVFQYPMIKGTGNDSEVNKVIAELLHGASCAYLNSLVSIFYSPHFEPRSIMRVTAFLNSFAEAQAPELTGQLDPKQIERSLKELSLEI